MEEECYCKSIEKKGISEGQLFKDLNPLASSKSTDTSSPKKGEFTSMLKCPQCNSYYLMNVHNYKHPNQETAPIKKYYLKASEDTVIETIHSLEGIITGLQLDQASKLRAVAKELSKKIREGKINKT